MRQRIRRLAIAALLLASSAWAGVDSWSPAGPGGGRVTRLWVDPRSADTVYAELEASGIFKSIDGGARWSRTGPPLPAPRPNGLVLDPAHPDTLYVHTTQQIAGGQLTQLFRSDDGGRTWSAIETDAPAGFRVLAVAPEDPPVLYGAGLDAGSNLSILRSRDGGASFQAVRRLDPPSGPVPLVVDPNDPRTVYAGGIQGVIKSRDGGDTWTVLNQVTSGEALGYPYHLAVAAGDTDVVYASRFGALYRSDDGGATWRQESALPQGCGVYALAVDPRDPQRVYSGCDFGAALSTNGGANWSRLTTGLPKGPVTSLPDGHFEPITALASSPTDPQRLYAGSLRHGVFRSGSGGRRWAHTSQGLEPREVRALAPVPGTGASFEALIFDTSGCWQPHRTDDAGATWSSLAIAPVCADWSVLVSDPTQPGTLYLGGDLGLFLSHDGGASWRRLFAENVATLTLDPGDPRRLLVGGAGAHLSTNGGRTWQRVIAGRIGLVSYGVRQILRDPTQPGTLYAAGEASIIGSSNGITWKSTHNGRRWREIPSPGNALQILSGEPSLLFTDNGWTSADGGATWSLTGFPGDELLVVGDGETFYGADRASIHRSEDRGASWQTVGHWQGCTGDRPSLAAAHPLAPERLFARGCLGGLAVAQWVDADGLELASGRLVVRAAWRRADGSWGRGRPIPQSSGAGFFALDGRHWPLAGVKVVDARALSGRFWLFLTSLSFAEQTFTVFDRDSGASVDVFHPAGAPASFTAFEALPALLEPPASVDPPSPGPPGESEISLLSGRFHARLRVQLDGGLEAQAQGMVSSDGVGVFWWQRRDSPEVMVRLVDGRAVNGHFWVIAGGLSSRRYFLEVIDLVSGAVHHTTHGAGAPITQLDLEAFAP